MIIMTLHHSKTKSLITVSVCKILFIFFFALIITLSVRAGVECGDIGLYYHICCGLDGIPWGEQLKQS